MTDNEILTRFAQVVEEVTGVRATDVTPAEVDPPSLLDPRAARTFDRSQLLALVAADEAWADAGVPAVDPDRLAVVVATGIGGVTTLLEQYDVLRERGARRVSPFTV